MIKSSIGSKAVVAITGFLLFGFVVAHMLGNLQIFGGKDLLNGYAEKLKSTGPILWGARAGLLLIFVTHIVMAIRLSIQNRAARPVGYVCDRTVQATTESRTMVLTGLLIAFFVVYHLCHFTFHVTNPSHVGTETLADGAKRVDVYRMVVLGFQNPLISAIYIFGQIVLGMHLRHGISSLFQTIGLLTPKLRGPIQTLGAVAATVIVVGNIAMPLACLFGFVKL